MIHERETLRRSPLPIQAIRSDRFVVCLNTGLIRYKDELVDRERTIRQSSEFPCAMLYEYHKRSTACPEETLRKTSMICSKASGPHCNEQSHVRQPPSHTAPKMIGSSPIRIVLRTPIVQNLEEHLRTRTDLSWRGDRVRSTPMYAVLPAGFPIDWCNLGQGTFDGRDPVEPPRYEVP